MPLGRRRPQMVGAAPDDGELLAVTALHVQHLGGVPAAVRRERPARLDAQGQLRVPFAQPGEPGAVRLPVEAPLRGGVVDVHAAADVHFGEPDAEPCRPRDDGLGHRHLLRGFEPAGQVGVHAAQFELRIRAVRQRADHRFGSLGIHAERGRPAAHGQGAAGQRPVGHRQVDARQHRDPPPGRHTSRQLGQHAQLVRALDMEALDSRRQRGRHLVRRLAGTAEGERTTRHRLGDMGEFAARGDLVAVDGRTERGQNLRLGVGLRGVVQLDPLGQRGAHGGGVGAQGRHVVDVRGQFGGRQGQDAVVDRGRGLGHRAALPVVSRRMSSASGDGSRT